MTSRPPIPTVVLVYGLLGLLPFLTAPVISLAVPPQAATATAVQAIYAGLILSFLGGARWGLEVARPAPRAVLVSLAMLPTLVALGLLILPAEMRVMQLCGLAALLVVHWVWDLWSHGLPGWYPRLRTILTLGAVTGILWQVLVVSRGL